MAGLVSRARVREDAAYKREIKLRAQTELFFLAHEILGYEDVTEYTHRQVADFFVHKDPSKSIKEQDTIKDRWLLLPRGTFKTTFNISDGVQWIVDFPDVRQLVITASNSMDSPLADAFVEEASGHFYQPQGALPTLFQELFPEHVVRKKPKSGWFITPARQKYSRSPSLMGGSIEQSLSGWHFDVIKLEDIQDNRNSQSKQARAKVKANFYINIKMLRPWGYREGTGTRYGSADFYGHVLDKLNPRKSKLLWKPAMTVKPGLEKKEEETPELLTADDYDLFFPEVLPYDFLMEKKEEDEPSFWTQYMNVATGGITPAFPKERLLQASVPDELVPMAGEVFIAWILPFGERQESGGAAAILEDGAITIVDAQRGQVPPSVVARRIVLMARKNGTHRVSIEETPGAHHYEAAIANEGIREGWPVTIQWSAFDEEESVRDLRIRNTEPELKHGRLFFAQSIPILKFVHRQFEKYGEIEERELADVISRLCERLPASIAMSAQDEDDETDWDRMIEQDRYDRLYNLGSHAPVDSEPLEEEELDVEPVPDLAGLGEIMPGLTG